MLDCFGRNLTELPSNVSKNTFAMDLSNNKEL